jgi:hypothetical protein
MSMDKCDAHLNMCIDQHIHNWNIFARENAWMSNMNMGVKLSQTTSKIVINIWFIANIYNVRSMSSYQNYNLDNERRCSKLQ